MAQNDFGTIDPNTKSGTDLASDLNDFRDAVNSNHSGTSEPSYVTEGMIWADVTSDAVVHYYDGTDSVPLFQIDETNNWVRWILDADEDSYLEASADDTIDLYLNDAQTVEFAESQVTFFTSIQISSAGGEGIVFTETDAATDNQQVQLTYSAESFGIYTRDASGNSLLYPNYIMGTDAAGATGHDFYVGSSSIFAVGSSGVTIDGEISFDSGIDGIHNVETGQIFRWDIDGDRRMELSVNDLKFYDASDTLTAQIPFNGVGAFGVLRAYAQTTGGGANLNVTSDGLIRRSTSSGEFKSERRTVAEMAEETGTSLGDLVAALNPVSFKSDHEADGGRRFVGFIAEEVAEVLPEASVDDGQNYDVRALVAVLWAEVQELRKRVAKMEA